MEPKLGNGSSQGHESPDKPEEVEDYMVLDLTVRSKLPPTVELPEANQPVELPMMSFSPSIPSAFRVAEPTSKQPQEVKEEPQTVEVSAQEAYRFYYSRSPLLPLSSANLPQLGLADTNVFPTHSRYQSSSMLFHGQMSSLNHPYIVKPKPQTAEEGYLLRNSSTSPPETYPFGNSNLKAKPSSSRKHVRPFKQIEFKSDGGHDLEEFKRTNAPYYSEFSQQKPHQRSRQNSVSQLPSPNGPQLKDQAYYEKRRKNNEAAKRSRDNRRKKEDEMAIRLQFTENKAKQLEAHLAKFACIYCGRRCI